MLKYSLEKRENNLIKIQSEAPSTVNVKDRPQKTNSSHKKS